MSRTRVKANQVGGQELETLKDELQNIKAHTGYIKGQVETLGDLDNMTVEVDDQVFVKSENKVKRRTADGWMDVTATVDKEQLILRVTSSTRPELPEQGQHIYETDTKRTLVNIGTPNVPNWQPLASGSGGGTGGGANQEELEELDNRVTLLEQGAPKLTKTFTENFKSDLSYVDTNKTNAIVGYGNVRTEKLATFIEDFSNTGYVYSSSNVNIDTSKRQVSVPNKGTVGIINSTIIPTTGTDYATIDASYDNSNSLAVETAATKVYANNERYSLTGSGSVVDKAGNLWVFSVLWNITLVVTMTTPEGVTTSANYVLDTSGTALYTTDSTLKSNICIDANGRLWFAQYYRRRVSSSSNCDFNVKLMIINPNNTLFKIADIGTIRSGTSTTNGAVSMVNGEDGNIYIATYGGFGGNSGSGVQSSYIHLGKIDIETGNVVKQTMNVVTGCAYASIPTIKLIVVPEESFVRIFYSNTHATTNGQIYHVTAAKDTLIPTAPFTYNATTKWPSIAGTAQMYNPAFFYAKGNSFVEIYSRDSNGVLSYNTFDFVTLTMSAPIVVAGTDSISPNALWSLHARRMTGGDTVLAYMTSDYVYYYLHLDKDNNVLVPKTPMYSEGGKITGVSVVNSMTYWNGNVVLSGHAMNAVIGETTYYPIMVYKFNSLSTSIKFEISNDGGLNWLPAEVGVKVDFPSNNNKITVKATLHPKGAATPRLYRYTVVEGSNSAVADLTRNFVSRMLPSTEVVNRATLTSTEELNGNQVKWYISNDGGATWMPASQGIEVKFANGGNDLRVKAELLYSYLQNLSPKILDYRITSGNYADASDYINIQINLMKTNFRLATLQNATRYAMKNLAIDDFNDASGIDVTKSTGYGFSTTEKNVFVPTVSNIDLTGATATSSYSLASGLSAANGIDGNKSTMVATQSISTGQSFVYTVDMKSIKKMNGLQVTWRADMLCIPKGLKVETSADNSTWETHYQVASGGHTPARNEEVFEFGKDVNVRYVRMSSTGAYTSDGSYVRAAFMEFAPVIINKTAIAEVVSVADTVTMKPSSVLLTVDENLGEDGSLEYSVSLDDGATWTVLTKDVATKVINATSTGKLRLKAKLVGTAKLNAWAYSWA